MTDHPVVSDGEWLEARRALLDKEKEFTRLRDELSGQRRRLPWRRVETDYVFDGGDGPVSLAELFGPHSQLMIYHFMFGPDWDAGCPSCSFWADNFDGIVQHLVQRDVAFAAVSRAPLARLREYRERMGWHFRWVSSAANEFNFDYQVSFHAEQQDAEVVYNYRSGPWRGDESPGLSVFHKDDAGAIFHTYSTYARGLDMINGAYHFLDLAPKGRDEAGLEWPQQWVHRHDEYDD